MFCRRRAIEITSYFGFFAGDGEKIHPQTEAAIREGLQFAAEYPYHPPAHSELIAAYVESRHYETAFAHFLWL